MLLILLFRHESEVDRLKSACVQAPVGLHVSLGPPAAADVGEVQWQFSAADRFYVGAVVQASVLSREAVGNWIKFTIHVMQVFKQGSAKVHRGTQFLWVSVTDLACKCPKIKVKQTYLILSKAQPFALRTVTPRDRTSSWVRDIPPKATLKFNICDELTLLESLIDNAQTAVEQHCMTRGDTQHRQIRATIESAEDQMRRLGPCPIYSCTKHHEPTKDSEMTEAGQYPLPKSPTLSPIKLTSPNKFKQVPRKKAARIQLEKSNSPIKTTNRFENLMDTPENVNTNDTQIKISTPDINLKLTDGYNLTIQEIARIFPETICKYHRGFIRISPHSLEDRDKIIESLDKSEKEYVLSEPPESRPIKIVIKNLPPDHNKDRIVRDLEDSEYKVIRINQLRNYRLKTLLPIFLVELAKTPNVNNIFQVEKINNFNVKIEHYRKKQRATMYYKCSDFFHSARNCRCKPRCIKCNGTHETRMCSIKTKIENPVCINCKENGHLASWKGCPKYPVIKNNTPPTYAQKLKSNLPKPDNTKPTPQIETDTYDKFVKNMNALKIINDAFNKFPNLIEISERIKLAKTDMEIVSLLLKIFKN
ncbi:hypothetical protein AVEN_210902-1 [Araneus ventricosus]|uniref:NTR domain-containing protein n=1 Tax=Araneus ventricosus TaxID=182803 RepID=A0A4Y2UQI3_ARAVE|nr:hypothetical protein AVEN_210902-1 [Araneus ventricosus]